jgi:hypothetical protein
MVIIGYLLLFICLIKSIIWIIVQRYFEEKSILPYDKYKANTLFLLIGIPDILVGIICGFYIILL